MSALAEKLLCVFNSARVYIVYKRLSVHRLERLGKRCFVRIEKEAQVLNPYFLAEVAVYVFLNLAYKREVYFGVDIAEGVGGHGDGDSVLLNDIFGTPAPDPFGKAADCKGGAMSILTGIAANASISTGMPISVMSLVDIPGYRKI